MGVILQGVTDLFLMDWNLSKFEYSREGRGCNHLPLLDPHMLAPYTFSSASKTPDQNVILGSWV